MTISYVKTCDIGINTIHKYMYISRSENVNIVCVMSYSVTEL